MSALESSVTLEDIFSVVEARRVPLAPELAGYLTLEIADGTQGTGGEVDPKTVYVSEEGTVALVRPKKDAPTGDAETSVRGILAKLLDASGSATPALSATAKRKPGAGMAAVTSELEAALIPVNRAAGRRALARLAREVKRVTLGVGRNASAPPVARGPAIRRIEKPEKAASAEHHDDAMSGPDAPPGPRSSFTEEAATAKRTNNLVEIAAQMNAPELINQPKAMNPALGLTPPPLPGVPGVAPPAPPPPQRLGPPPIPAPTARPGAPPPPARSAGVPAPPGRPKAGEPRPADAKGAPETLFGGDEVDSLLASFEVSSTTGEKQMARDLKAIAGLDPTPGPPDAQKLESLTKDIGKDLPKIAPRDSGSSSDVRASAETNDLDALLAMTDGPAKAAPPAAPPPTAAKPDSSPQLPPASVLQTKEPEDASPAPGPGLAPPSPLVPMAPEPPPLTRPVSPGSMPEVPAAEPALKRPITPPRHIPQAAPSTSPGATGRHRPPPEGAAPVPSSRRSARPGKQTTGSHRRPRAPRTGLVMLVLTLIVLVAGGAAIWMWKPAFFTGRRRPVPTASTSVVAPPAPAPRCKVALVVTDVPPNAEILLRMGQAQLDVERMPMGTRLEFVATAEGHAPRRAVIKADSTWDKGTDGKPRIDVPIQLDPSKAKPGTLDPWPAAEPGSQVGGSGSPGTVHVLSTPRAAEIWLLAGLGPEARIEQLRCDADIDVLLAGPPQLRKRLHVSEKDIQAATPDAQGNRVITVTGKSP